ncbi:MAG: NADPH-dependent FMN reductase [Parahaliea sp.]
MTRLLALSGSLRKDSFNTELARIASRVAPAGVVVDVATLHGIPLYDGDLEVEQGIPDSVLALKERIVASDGLLLLTPEYNSGIPGVMKNGIDWLSRADLKAVFSRRPVAVIGATPGGWGTLSAQNAWLPTLHMLGAREYSSHRLLVSHAHTLLPGDNTIADATVEKMLIELLAGFAKFIEQQHQ